jgi:hypothetical protein
VPTPASFKADVKTDTIEVIPLLKDGAAMEYPGWCSYGSTLEGQPEIEIFCGGINSKQAGAAAIWRQGNLLHWGFEQAPDQLNDVGKSLLVNAIVYISRFADDRVTIRTRSPFSGKSTPDRASAAKWIADDKLYEWGAGLVAPPAGISIDNRNAFRAWFAENERFMHGNGDRKLVLDEEAKALDLDWKTIEFFDRALAILSGTNGDASRAAAVLSRHAPDGPGAGATADAWRNWLKENRPYLFYCERASYGWCIDPLAKKRGVPTNELRGPARADVRAQRK